MDGNEPFTGWGSHTSRVGGATAKTLASTLSTTPRRLRVLPSHDDHRDPHPPRLPREERAAALAWGADAIPAYLEDLEREIEDYRSAYVGAAVTEIASFRALLSGPQVG